MLILHMIVIKPKKKVDSWRTAVDLLRVLSEDQGSVKSNLRDHTPGEWVVLEGSHILVLEEPEQ